MLEQLPGDLDLEELPKVSAKGSQGTDESGRSPSFFSRFTRAAATAAGQPIAFALALTLILSWAVSGPIFGFGSTWQLVINTGTTIITFLMVFLVQDTQNRDAAAMQIKLDEIIRVLESADNSLLDLEHADQSDLDQTRGQYEALAHEAHDKSVRKAGEVQKGDRHGPVQTA